MPLVTEADVAAGVVSVWNADTKLQELAGKLYFGRVPLNDKGKAVAIPYATLKVEAGEFAWTSGTVYSQVFAVTVAVWSAQGVTNGGDIKGQMLATFDRNLMIGKMPIPNGNCREHKPVSGEKFELDQTMKNAQDVLAAGQRWECWVQGKRPAPLNQQ